MSRISDGPQVTTFLQPFILYSFAAAATSCSNMSWLHKRINSNYLGTNISPLDIGVMGISSFFYYYHLNRQWQSPVGSYRSTFLETLPYSLLLYTSYCVCPVGKAGLSIVLFQSRPLSTWLSTISLWLTGNWFITRYIFFGSVSISGFTLQKTLRIHHRWDVVTLFFLYSLNMTSIVVCLTLSPLVFPFRQTESMNCRVL